MIALPEKNPNHFALSTNPDEPLVPDALLDYWCSKADRSGNPDLRALMVHAASEINRFDRARVRENGKFVGKNRLFIRNGKVVDNGSPLHNRAGRRVLFGREAVMKDLHNALLEGKAYNEAFQEMLRLCNRAVRLIEQSNAPAIEPAAAPERTAEPAPVPEPMPEPMLELGASMELAPEPEAVPQPEAQPEATPEIVPTPAKPAPLAVKNEPVRSQLAELFPRRQSILSRKAVKPYETLCMGEQSNPAGLAQQVYALAAKPIRKNEDAATQWAARLKELKALAKQVETGTLPAPKAAHLTAEADRTAAQALDRLLTLNKGSGEAQQLARVQMFVKAARADGRQDKTALQGKAEDAIHRSIARTAESFGSSIAKYSVNRQGKHTVTHREPAPPIIEASGIYTTIDRIVRGDAGDSTKWRRLEQLVQQVADARYDPYQGHEHITPSRLNDTMRRLLNECAVSDLPASNRVALVREALDQFRPAAEYANRYHEQQQARSQSAADAPASTHAAPVASHPASSTGGRSLAYRYPPGHEPRWYQKRDADKKFLTGVMIAGSLAVAGVGATHPDNVRSLLGMPVASAPMDDDRYTSTENPTDHGRRMHERMLQREAERERRFEERLRGSADIPPFIPEPSLGGDGSPGDAAPLPAYEEPLDSGQQPSKTEAHAEPLPSEVPEGIPTLHRQADHPPLGRPEVGGEYRFTARLVPPAVSHAEATLAADSLPGTPSR